MQLKNKAMIDFFNNVLEKVRQIPLSEIIYDIYQVPKGICPFHNDRHAGSFHIFKNRFHCFSCGESGDGIHFVQMQDGVPFQQAVLQLALNFNIITLQQMEDYLEGSITSEVVKAPPRVYTGIFDGEEYDQIANSEVLHHVFSVFSEGINLIKKNSKLSSKHLKHLRDERKLTDDEINNAGYFTMPPRTNLFMNEFLQEIKKRYGYEEEVLKQVPGFYWVDKIGRMTFIGHKGLGIPIKNERGQIVGVQIRRDNVKKGDSRYIWFSSSFANERDGMRDGTGSGSPIHVSYPKTIKKKEDIYITEGIFKSEWLAKHQRAISVSLQGVQNWKGKIEPLIEYLEEEKNQAILRIHIYFDADVSENTHVYTAFKDMYQSLKESFPNIDFYYYWWKKEYGKGIDDLLLNKLGNEVRRIDCETYVSAYDEMIERLEAMYAEKIIKIDKTVIHEEYERSIAPLFSLHF